MYKKFELSQQYIDRLAGELLHELPGCDVSRVDGQLEASIRQHVQLPVAEDSLLQPVNRRLELHQAAAASDVTHAKAIIVSVIEQQ